MGFLFRVRIASFFAGAATASIAGFYLLYKDYMFAHDAIRLQVNNIYQTVDERYEALNQRTTILEIQKDAAATDKSTEVLD
ncbi:uncharacterized protein LOC121984544 [Zingiber officinale]|uniref:uncharacterized protein LOC121984544 n=1 Tax=Zingiber officinale TaxID=94328 RepID=UPI001C4DD119|nr:uncharacterized protein LOC121984544 [Zingiber officinale]